MTDFETSKHDFAWLATLEDRKAVLWICKTVAATLVSDTDLAASILAHSWHSVYIEGNDLDQAVEASSHKSTLGQLKIRTIASDPDDAGNLAANRLPIYIVPEADPHENPLEYATRLKMFQRLPRQATLFILTAEPETDLRTVLQATRTTEEGVREAVVVCKRPPSCELQADRLVHWMATPWGLFDLLETAGPIGDTAAAAIRIHTNTGVATVDFSDAVDPSYPITDRFYLLPATQVLAEVPGDEQQVRSLLDSSTFSIEPYAAGVVFNRIYDVEKHARKALRRFKRDHSDATCTAWIDAEQASGATTALRDLAFRLAREGYPVLLARPEVMNFDFQQISIFLKNTNRIATEGTDGRLAEYPWVLMFDAEHAIRSNEFLIGLASGLRKREQAALVVGVRPLLASTDAGGMKAHGPNQTFGETFTNVVSREEAAHFGEHLNRFLPPQRQRNPRDWQRFCEESEQLTGDGKRSLFWLAVRFWLFRMPDAEQPLRRWLTEHIKITNLRLLAAGSRGTGSRRAFPAPAGLPA